MKKYWFIATYKINEVRILERNLLNQKFNYYLPKITTKKFNSKPKTEALFPGYIFINTSLDNYSSLKYTLGIKKIIKFGNNIPCISYEEIKAMQMTEEASKIDPVDPKIQIGQDLIIAKGSLAGSIVKVCSLLSKERVSVLLSFLGSVRRVTISEKDLAF